MVSLQADLATRLEGKLDHAVFCGQGNAIKRVLLETVAALLAENQAMPATWKHQLRRR